MTSPFTDRRRLITGLAAGGLTTALGGRAQGFSVREHATSPFTLGVASGSPTSDGFVLWTRLAPAPLAPDGRGGLAAPTPVRYEIATDDGFANVVRTGDAIADPAFAHAAHVEVVGLQPNRPYWYRFMALGHRSPVGRARTAPRPGQDVARLRFAFASCSHWELGFFSAYRHMAAEDPDLVLFLGDYIYEYSYRGARAAKVVRPHDRQDELSTLADYRNRYALYRTDPDLQALHATAPCLVTWDDHEVENDYANRWSEDPRIPVEDFLRRRAAAYRAFYEHMPLRHSARPHGPGMRIYGHTDFGTLASFTVLDGRQYRTRQPCPTATSRRGHVDLCPDLTDPARTMLGWRQERWLQDRFRSASARWTIVPQDLLVARLEQKDRAGTFGHFTDGWDGYQAGRDRMLAGLARSGARNPVFLAGDIHSFWANDLKADFRDPGSANVATEFVTSGVTADNPPTDAFADIQTRNPHVRFVDLETQGYASAEVSTGRMDVAFRTISDRRDPNASVSTLARFSVEDGRAGVQPA